MDFSKTACLALYKGLRDRYTVCVDPLFCVSVNADQELVQIRVKDLFSQGGVVAEPFCGAANGFV